MKRNIVKKLRNVRSIKLSLLFNFTVTISGSLFLSLLFLIIEDSLVINSSEVNLSGGCLILQVIDIVFGLLDLLLSVHKVLS